MVLARLNQLLNGHQLSYGATASFEIETLKALIFVRKDNNMGFPADTDDCYTISL